MNASACQRCGISLLETMKFCPECGCYRDLPSQPKKSGTFLKWVLALGVIYALIMVTWSASVAPPKSSSPPAPSEPVFNSAWDGSVYQAERWLKNNLKDPDSFKPIEWSPVVKQSDGYLVRCKYRAKNSFGGYVIEEVIFILDSKGEVIETAKK